MQVMSFVVTISHNYAGEEMNTHDIDLPDLPPCFEVLTDRLQTEIRAYARAAIEAALQSQDREDAFIDGVLLGLQVIAGSGNAGNADHDELMRSAGVDLVVRRAIDQEMWELAGLDRNQISIKTRRRIEGEGK